MDVDPKEVARFKKLLARLPIEEIERRLDRSIIMRPWKRRVAEAERGRREEDTLVIEERTEREADGERRRQRKTSRDVWLLIAAAVFLVVVVIWAVVAD
jgi:hypothetical protein